MERMGGFYSSILDGNCASRKPPQRQVGISGPKTPIVFVAISLCYINANLYVCIYIYSHPGVDRIWYMFNPDFKNKMVEIFSKHQFLHVLFSLLKSF